MARRLAALITVLLVVVTAGCQSDAGDRPGTSESAAASISTKFGAVTPPKNPQRVVALGWGDAETALALGVQPVGAADWLAFGGEGVGPWAEGRYEKSPKILGTLELSYEDVAALKPDLILDTKASGDQKRYQQLSKIAPTVGVPKGGDNYATTMDIQVEMIGKALGRVDRATRLLADVHDQFAATTAKYPQLKGKTVTVAANSSNGWGAYIKTTDRVRFMTDLGLRNSPAVDAAEPDGFSVEVSEENLDLLDADLLVVMPIGTSAQEIEKSKLFRQVPAVEQGHYVILDNPTISRAYAVDSLLSVRYALDKVPPLLAAALKS
ncbi:iron-siderophore ABC transporter substrate-binding protein [Microlunatus soli]|uniref:Iron complex transport system substrate-binding protein n=1 Tax=Microlunatus soli TaxID=630515 RepID=A0A1H1Z6Y7_9ACTN|nr:iron-siderophore ABC transporter substrate-binding protein [Microlunatus soli]SDT29531.1 iron complex transport system substrate-binding protein [Microlunatus soli]